MISLINTPSSRGAWAIDAFITAAGWVGFVYLIGNGIAVVIGSGNPAGPAWATARPTIETLMGYATIAAFNALLVVLWVSYQDSFFRSLRHKVALGVLDDETVASHFALPSNVLREIQVSQVTVIYHADDGAITHLETDQLRVHPAANMPLRDIAQAA